MKTINLIFPFFLFVIFACSSDDNKPKEELEVRNENLQGAWIAKEDRRNDGGELGSFKPISESNQFTYVFKHDLSVSDSFIECDGSYHLNEETNILQLFFNCIEEDIIWEVSSVSPNELILASRVSEESYTVKFNKTNN